MGKIVRFEISRAPREPISKPATVRRIGEHPVDIDILNLSVSGALVASNEHIPIGSTITIGIPGLGMRLAKVTRAGEGIWACTFFPRLDTADLDKVRTAKSVLVGRFTKLKGPARDMAAVRSKP